MKSAKKNSKESDFIPDIRFIFLIVVFLFTVSCESNGNSNIDTDGDNAENDSSEIPVTVDGDFSEQSDKMPENSDEFDQENFVCDGNCTGNEPPVCISKDLCTCKNGRFEQTSCEEICTKTGHGEVIGCSYNSEQNSDLCVCTEPSVECIADYIVDSLPYKYSGDTRSSSNDFALSVSCFDWGLLANDDVFEIKMHKGNEIVVKLSTKDALYDPAIVISSGCSNFSRCLAGSDEKWSAKGEEFSFKASKQAQYFIVVDSGYKEETSESKGPYSLEITGDISPPPVDGDMEMQEKETGESELEADFENMEFDKEMIEYDQSTDQDIDLKDQDMELPPVDGDFSELEQEFELEMEFDNIETSDPDTGIDGDIGDSEILVDGDLVEQDFEEIEIEEEIEI